MGYCVRKICLTFQIMWLGNCFCVKSNMKTEQTNQNKLTIILVLTNKTGMLLIALTIITMTVTVAMKITMK